MYDFLWSQYVAMTNHWRNQSISLSIIFYIERILCFSMKFNTNSFGSGKFIFFIITKHRRTKASRQSIMENNSNVIET
jgi:hypothetical protein